MAGDWKIYNKAGEKKVLVTKMLPGEKWLDVLLASNFKVEVNTSDNITPQEELIEKMGEGCQGVIGQLTESWDSNLFEILKHAGGAVYSNYAVGFDNVDVVSATKNQVAIGNTPGVLTETTAEMAVALTLACARKIVEADNFMRQGKYKGWLPDLFLGERLKGKTVGIVGAGKIGSAYANMMCQGFKMNLIYLKNSENKELEREIELYNDFLKKTNTAPITWKRATSLHELLSESDVVSLHTPLTKETHHFIAAKELSTMKRNAILINTSRGPIIDEAALTKHCRENINFKAGLDVFEEEPLMNKDLKKLGNVTVAPHIASATSWTREGMALLAALNVKGVLEHYPLWDALDMTPFLGERPPKAVPSIVNAGLLEDILPNQNK